MPTGQKVAVKIIEQIADNIEEIEEEYLILRDLCLHPNIPSFYGIYLKKSSRREDDQLWFVMEVTSRFSLLPSAGPTDQPPRSFSCAAADR